MMCKSTVMIAEFGYGMILFGGKELVLANTSKPAVGHHPSAYVIGR